jgi:hypothetical protein
MKRLLASLGALSALACGSSDDEREFSGDCGGISAAFQVSEQRVSGTCPVSSDPYVISVTGKPDQTADVNFPDFGLECGGAVNACNIKGNCPVRAGTPEAIVGSVSIDLTLQPTGIQGSYSVTLNPGGVPDVPDGCTGRFTVSGTRLTR